MKAILIDSKNREVKEVEVKDYSEYNSLIGCLCFTVATYLGNGNDKQEEDVIFVDDEGLLTEPEHFFTYEGAHQPFAGNGLVIGCDYEGESKNPLVTLEEVKNKVKFFSAFEVALGCKLGVM